MLQGPNSQFWAFKNRTASLGSRLRLRVLSTFCFFLYFREVVHKSSVL